MTSTTGTGDPQNYRVLTIDVVRKRSTLAFTRPTRLYQSVWIGPKLIAAVEGDQWCHVYDIRTGREVGKFALEKNESLHDGSSSNSVVTVRDPNVPSTRTVSLRSIPDGTIRWQIHHKGFVSSAVFSRDGNELITGSGSALRVFSTRDGRLKRTLQAGEKVSILSAGIAGNRAGAVTLLHGVFVWDLRTGERIAVDHHGAGRIVFGDDEGLFATLGSHGVPGSHESLTKVWTSKGKLLARLPGRFGTLAGAFAREGHAFVAAEGDELLNLWTINQRELSVLACRSVSEGLTLEEWRMYFPDEPYVEPCGTLRAVSNK